MFHLIYTRSNTEYYKGDTFESHITLYRNIPYSELSKFLEMQKDPELLKECDTKYFEHQEKNGITDTCFHSEISIVDDEEYFIEAKSRQNLNIHQSLDKAIEKSGSDNTVLFWKKLKKRDGNSRRSSDGMPEVVSMSYDLFIKLLNK